jgi:hypothetical protein
LRHSSRALRDGELTLLRAEGAAIAYLRRQGADAFVCALDADETPLAWDLALPQGVRSAEVVPLRSARASTGVAEVVDGGLRASLPGRHAMVVRLLGD